jgi:hypothetical protein
MKKHELWCSGVRLDPDRSPRFMGNSTIQGPLLAASRHRQCRLRGEACFQP